MSSSASLIQLTNGQKAFGMQTIFNEASFAINEDEHVGVIGPNGAGKTTLFKILLGLEDLDGGEIVKSRNLRLGYLSQHDNWDENETGNSYLEKVCKIPIWEAKLKGKELQLTDDIFAKPILSLSGGYRMRLKLVGLLGCDPNLMLLDEPTNYLDLETTLLLENFLQSYEGAFLLISHDREVLRRTTDHTLEIETGEIIKFNGNIDDYFEQKELLREQLAAQLQNQEAKKKTIMDFVNRFGSKATKAKQAQSKLKTLQKMEIIEVKALPVKAAIKIPPPAPVGKYVLNLKAVDFGYNDYVILKNISLEIKRGDHVAVVGLNGAGKSTLLKGLAGTINPLRGDRTLGFQAQIAIFNQHVVEFLNANHSVYDSLSEVASSDIKEQEIRNMAGSLLFSADTIEKKISVLSGGEKSRVALGRVLLQKAPCLLLDEPTNHLDFQTVEALTQALNSYEGTIIVVSHDRDFIKRVGKKILEVSEGKVNVYPGSYDEYVWSLQKNLQPTDSNQTDIKVSKEVTEEKSISQSKQYKENSKKLRQLEKDIANIEKSIAQLEALNVELNQKIASGDFSNQNKEFIQKLSENSQKIEDLEQQWLILSEQLGDLS